MAKNKQKDGSKYQGGFKTVNGRLNNTSAYNHDYYIRNKDRWQRYSEKHKKPKKKYNAIQDWFGLDEHDAYRKSWDVYYDTQDYNDSLRSFDRHNGFYHPVKGMDWEGSIRSATEEKG